MYKLKKCTDCVIHGMIYPVYRKTDEENKICGYVVVYGEGNEVYRIETKTYFELCMKICELNAEQEFVLTDRGYGKKIHGLKMFLYYTRLAVKSREQGMYEFAELSVIDCAERMLAIKPELVKETLESLQNTLPNDLPSLYVSGLKSMISYLLGNLK